MARVWSQRGPMVLQLSLFCFNAGDIFAFATLYYSQLADERPIETKLQDGADIQPNG